MAEVTTSNSVQGPGVFDVKMKFSCCRPEAPSNQSDMCRVVRLELKGSGLDGFRVPQKHGQCFPGSSAVVEREGSCPEPSLSCKFCTNTGVPKPAPVQAFSGAREKDQVVHGLQFVQP